MSEETKTEETKVEPGLPEVLSKLDAVLAALAALAAPKTAETPVANAEGEAVHKPVHTPGEAAPQEPDYLKIGRERDLALEEYRAANPDASFEAAWDAVRRAKPELFK